MAKRVEKRVEKKAAEVKGKGAEVRSTRVVNKYKHNLVVSYGNDSWTLGHVYCVDSKRDGKFLATTIDNLIVKVVAGKQGQILTDCYSKVLPMRESWVAKRKDGKDVLDEQGNVVKVAKRAKNPNFAFMLTLSKAKANHVRSMVQMACFEALRRNGLKGNFDGLWEFCTTKLCESKRTSQKVRMVAYDLCELGEEDGVTTYTKSLHEADSACDGVVYEKVLGERVCVLPEVPSAIKACTIYECKAGVLTSEEDWDKLIAQHAGEFKADKAVAD